MANLHCVVVIGTRPEAIKMAPVVLALREKEGVQTTLLSSGQHREMVEQVLALFDLAPDHDLRLMTKAQDLSAFAQRALGALTDYLREAKADVVLVQGDTTTSFVAALAAFYLGIEVVHVEAGLRTDQLRDPFPEEANRRLTGVITSLHLAPTESARKNLLIENVDPDKILVTGNPVIDALRLSEERASNLAKENYPFLADTNDRIVLVTAHRRENHGAPMERICRAALKLVAEEPGIRIVWPVHPNPAVSGPVQKALGGKDRIHLVPPLDYGTFIGLVALSSIALTDSGGVQEEAPALGKPVLVLRETTERPEGIDSGNAKLVGTDVEKIVQEALTLLRDPDAYKAMSEAACLYGDGRAGECIADAVVERFSAPSPLVRAQGAVF